MKQSRFIAVAAGLAGMAGLAFGFAAGSGAAQAEQINTAGEKGAYNHDFCPRLSRALRKSKFDYECVTSQGSRENMERVARSPKDIGYAQLDVFALQSGGEGAGALSLIRSDIGRECLFVVTKNKNFKSLSDLGALADKLRFILPSEKSGGASTFSYLKKVDAGGLAQVKNVEYAQTIDVALDKVLGSDENTATLFVQFPDPNNPRFQQVRDSGGHFVPVIDRDILGQQVGGEKVYYAQETEIATATLLKKHETLTTACTPLALFTGTPEAAAKAAGDKAKGQQSDLIKTVKALDRADLMPRKGFLASAWSRTKELSAEATDKFLTLSHTAREKAEPYVDAAKEKAGQAVEKAKELGGKAKEKTVEAAETVKEKAGDAAEKAKETGKSVVDKAKELGEKAKEKAGEAAEKAKEAGKAAVEKAKEVGEKVKEKAGEAAEKAKEAGKAAVEKAKEVGEKAKEKVKEHTGGEQKPAAAAADEKKPAAAAADEKKPAAAVANEKKEEKKEEKKDEKASK